MNLVKTTKDRFLAIDANAIVHRAFHAYPATLQTEDGVQVNAVYGFTVMLLSALKTFDPKYVLCSFDTSKPTFRHVEFAEYKATRKPTDQSLIDQFPMVEEILKAFNIPILKKEGFEADDILGTISKYVTEGKWSSENLDLYILSGDRDLLQLVNEKVKVCLPAGNFKNLVAYDREETFKYMGLYPEQIVDYKAIAGDTSDNIPGVKGVGDKTTQELLAKYGTFEGIYKNLGEVKPRYANLLREGIEQAELSRMLAKIEQEVGVDIRMEACVLKDFEKSRVVDMFKKYSFRSLLPRLDDLKEDSKIASMNQLDMFASPRESVVWSNVSEVENTIKDCKSITLVNIPSEESSIEEPYFIIRTTSNSGKITNFLTKEIFDIGMFVGEIVTYGYEEIIFKNPSFMGKDILDVELLAHIVNSEKRSFKLKDLSFDYSSISLQEKISPQDMIVVLDVVQELAERLKSKASEIELYEYTRKSLNQFLNIKQEYLVNVAKLLEVPISGILSKMENRGLKVDVQFLEELNSDLLKKTQKLSEEIYATVGHEFNINSPKQLSDILFNELGLSGGKSLSTRESVLKELVGFHPCIEKILEYRELNKVFGTYTSPLLEMAKSDKENAIHTDFKQTGTTSGRLSSANPNLQNIPSQGDLAMRLRKAFVPREGFKLVGMDYSQIELRIMADMSQDNLLIEDFKNGLDIHTSTASRILGKEMEDISKQERSVGKTVNFAILFGQSAYGLANMLKVSNEVALGYIQNYFAHYVGVESYIRSLEKEAYKKGYVQSMFGTTRYIRGLKSKNLRMRKAAQREAVNMPIQGSEADIMKLAMRDLDDLIVKEFENDAYILLQVHDELIFEVRSSRVTDFADKAKEIMIKVVSLDVPLDVHSSFGSNMSELK